MKEQVSILNRRLSINQNPFTKCNYHDNSPIIILSMYQIDIYIYIYNIYIYIYIYMYSIIYASFPQIDEGIHQL